MDSFHETISFFFQVSAFDGEVSAEKVDEPKVIFRLLSHYVLKLRNAVMNRRDKKHEARTEDEDSDNRDGDTHIGTGLESNQPRGLTTAPTGLHGTIPK